MTAWMVEHVYGTAASLHARSAALAQGAGGVRPRRRVRFLEASGPAVVLGSAQRDDVVDRDRAAAASIEVARRPSGGGAVLVGPGHVVWVDLVIPAGDPLWLADVGRAMWWVGDLWCRAIGALVATGAVPAVSPSVWRGPLVRGAWSDLVCFAGLGAGEVRVARADGRPAKVVGISQRRTRSAALFQCAALLEWRPGPLLDVLNLDHAARRGAAQALEDLAVGLGRGVAPGLSAALLDALGELGTVTPGPGSPAG